MHNGGCQQILNKLELVKCSFDSINCKKCSHGQFTNVISLLKLMLPVISFTKDLPETSSAVAKQTEFQALLKKQQNLDFFFGLEKNVVPISISGTETLF